MTAVVFFRMRLALLAKLLVKAVDFRPAEQSFRICCEDSVHTLVHLLLKRTHKQLLHRPVPPLQEQLFTGMSIASLTDSSDAQKTCGDQSCDTVAASKPAQTVSEQQRPNNEAFQTPKRSNVQNVGASGKEGVRKGLKTNVLKH